MLYTVWPLERVYARPASYTDIKQENPKEAATMEYREVSLQHGKVVARRDGENYIVEQLYSTDMQDYLKADYSPGKNIKI
ncbi:MAG: hypothetical protein H6Q59_2419 [Firmicutes bacterium]|nr:hypothetical protein [Bacillota bacterium]